MSTKHNPIRVYYGGGKSYVQLNEHTFFCITDDGQKRTVVNECPKDLVETTETSDNRGLTGGYARSLIATACEVARAMKESSNLLA